MTEITDVHQVQAGDTVTIRVVSDDRAQPDYWGQEFTFTTTGPVEYLGQGVGSFTDTSGYGYGMGGYEVYEFVKAERS